MTRVLLGTLIAFSLGCAAGAPPIVASRTPDTVVASATTDPGSGEAAARSTDAITATDAPSVASSTGQWIGAAGASDFLLAGTTDTVLGVWVDVPAASTKGHAPTSVALVIDTSGSMSGSKIENARHAARSFVEQLSDGDIVSVHTFADQARERVQPTSLNASTRAAIYGTLASLEATGGTNLFDGLRFGENRVQTAPATHPVRRVVVISDGIANIGPSSPEILGELAARGAESGVQVTALGVGLDYDERTLNALAVRSSGRLYHLSEPRELAAMLEREISLLQATATTGAFVDVVPAPGVQLLGADGVRADRIAGGGLRIPLGTMFSGQHREMALRVRVTAAGDGSRPLASVRFHFKSSADGNLERVQEVVARYEVTGDSLAIARHQNAKTQSIAARQEAAQVTIAAAQQLNDGRFDAAEKDLARVETKLRASAALAPAEDRQRMMATAARISSVRQSAKAAASAPPAAAPSVRRAGALDANKAGMEAAGY